MDLRTKLTEAGYAEETVKKFLSHLHACRTEGKYTMDIKDDYAYSAFTKVANLGLPFDGISVVFTGSRMFMITADGYKNRVLQTYPETQIDIQLMREGDSFKVKKESGAVLYEHLIANPFEDNKIIGAYVVMKNHRGEYFETLNESDFEKMKSGSKQSMLWDKWASEFWLKSVMKRACKRHFKDIVIDIDQVDNEDYGQATDDKKDAIVEAHNERD